MFRSPNTLAAAFPTPQFLPLNGHLELTVAEAVSSVSSRPQKITTILQANISHLNEQPTDPELLNNLSSAGREWLLHKTAHRFYTTDWFETQCPMCAKQFDLNLSLQHTPRTLPTASFPVIEVQTSLGLRSFETPNGHFELALTHHTQQEPRRLFASICGLHKQAEYESHQFTDDDLAKLDVALEKSAPDIADSIDVVCPECQHPHRARIDPLNFAFPQWENILTDVHIMAFHYHWSEAAILELPQQRRRAYVSMIVMGQQGVRRQ